MINGQIITITFITTLTDPTVLIHQNNIFLAILVTLKTSNTAAL